MKLDYMVNEGKILETKAQKINKTLNGFLLYALIIIVITFMIWSFYHEAKVVKGESMQPMINSTYDKNNSQNFDIVLMNKTKNFKRQDIVIVDFRGYEDELIIKRVIATAGDSIKIVEKNGHSVVWLKKANKNEWAPLKEDYVLDGNNGIKCATTFMNRYSSINKWVGCTENNDYTYSLATDKNIFVSEAMFYDYYIKDKDDENKYNLTTTYNPNNEYYIKIGENNYQQQYVTEAMFYDYYIKEGASYIKATEYIPDRPYYVKNHDGSITINDGYFFALGDNRENSWDCSEVGPLEVSRIQGVVETLIPDNSFLNKFLRKLLNLKLND